MKASSIIGIIVVLLILAAGGWWFMRSQEPTEQQIEEMFEESEDVIEGEGQFLQRAPEETAPGSADLEEATILEATSDLPGDEVTISITDNGFEPETVTIASGTTVTFVNNGQANHWPASDVHPTHEILPDFDAKGGLATGDTYSYTFEEAGTWRCHDHLFPSSTCAIIVE